MNEELRDTPYSRTEPPPSADRVRHLDQQIRSLVSQYPLPAVAIAVGAGFVLARWVTR